MSRDLKNLQRFIVGLTTVLGLFCSVARVEAADSVVLRYSFLRERVSVAELATFAETGELSRSLRAYLRMASREPEQLSRTLTQEVEVNPNLLYRVLNTPPGELLLDQVSEVIHTPSNRANRQSLRSALVSSALSDGKITLLETFQNYPTSEVHVNGNRLVEVVGSINLVVGRRPSVRI